MMDTDDEVPLGDDVLNNEDAREKDKVKSSDSDVEMHNVMLDIAAESVTVDMMDQVEHVNAAESVTVDMMDQAEHVNAAEQANVAGNVNVNDVNGRYLFNRLEFVDTVLPTTDDILEKLSEIRKFLYDQESISDRTLKCLEIMVKMIMTQSFASYISNEEDCFDDFYINYLEELENMWTQVMNTLPKYPISSDMSAVITSATAFQRKISDHNVMGEVVLKKLPHLLPTLQNGDIEGFKWLMLRIIDHITTLYIILNSYFQMLGKLESFLRIDMHIQFGTTAGISYDEDVIPFIRGVVEHDSRTL